MGFPTFPPFTPRKAHSAQTCWKIMFWLHTKAQSMVHHRGTERHLQVHPLPPLAAPSASLSRTLVYSVHLSVRPALCSACFHGISGASLLSKAHCGCGIQRREELDPRHAKVLSWKKKRKTKEICGSDSNKELSVTHVSALKQKADGKNCTANKKWPWGWFFYWSSLQNGHIAKQTLQLPR